MPQMAQSTGPGGSHRLIESASAEGGTIMMNQVGDMRAGKGPTWNWRTASNVRATGHRKTPMPA